MLAVRSVMKEAIEQLHAVAIVASDALELLRVLFIVVLERVKPLLFHPIRGALIENFHFIKSSFQVLGRTSLDLDGYICVVLDVFREPHSGEVTPSELLDDDVASDQHLANMHAVISADLVVRQPLIF